MENNGLWVEFFLSEDIISKMNDILDKLKVVARQSMSRYWVNEDYNEENIEGFVVDTGFIATDRIFFLSLRYKKYGKDYFEDCALTFDVSTNGEIVKSTRIDASFDTDPINIINVSDITDPEQILSDILDKILDKNKSRKVVIDDPMMSITI